VSAGYDAHEHDPLAMMRMTAAGYAAVVSGLRAIAERHGAIALVTEGGYDLPALAECLEASFAVLDGGGPPPAAEPPAPSALGERAAARAAAALRGHWRFL
jgi:acetoin utilization deacetylase AcuC-like enzyme